MINERRILLMSETLGRLTACIHSAATLIYPMHWSVAGFNVYFHTLLINLVGFTVLFCCLGNVDAVVDFCVINSTHYSLLFIWF